ncbi:MAG TPA: zinc-dependent alcohol dehydrogenase family protein [Aggregatilinea sp.]|uniref:zinc-dependent alcohol dehydrogenase family protein n=1 Tax=Aggregatilinea sp. TaxID=2806333 RepID=UPI002C8E9290|nr:zinc-dependent alcohol dehydrogenase family protein [Aggregatilinea sp.]HML21371.1 zinc-dependent alcohol dehydrogenase family protein [Aggregatilinea sp.]
MKAGKIEQPGRAGFSSAPVPEPGPDDVLIQVHAAGICGTDIHILKGEYEARYPLIPGHEFSGVVVSVGDNVTRFKVGDRVTADPNIPCNRCLACQRNEPNQCENLQAVGVTRDGAFAEYVVVPEGNVFAIGEMSFAAAAMVEPLACVAWGLERLSIPPGASALVFGAGPMGCLLSQALHASGAARVVVTDVVPHRLALAAELGATETVLADDQQDRKLRSIEPGGYNLVVDATGIPKVLEAAFSYLRARGTLWVFGVTPNDARVTFPSYEIFRRDLAILGSFAVNRTFQESISMIRSGRVKVEPLISHTLPLEDFAQGFELAQSDPRRMKVQYQIGS